MNSYKPALATLVDAPPSGPNSKNWIHEVKLDGYRLIAIVSPKKAYFMSRNGINWTAKLKHLAKPVFRILKRNKLKHLVLDGELVAITPEGKTDFSAIQKAFSDENYKDLHYYIFDVIKINGEDLTQIPLIDRKKKLTSLFKNESTLFENTKIHLSEFFEEEGQVVLDNVCRLGLEGIVSKEKQSLYLPGRTRQWLKIRCSNKQEFVVLGFTYSKAISQKSGFRSLVLGTHDISSKDKDFIYVGKVGTGFSTKQRTQLRKKLQRLRAKKTKETTKLPSTLTRSESNEIIWVKPTYVAEIEYSEKTTEGILRHPRFLGIREDKSADEVFLEKPKSVFVKGVKISNPKKYLYEHQHISKKDLADFYVKVSHLVMPFIQNRPLSLVRCPNGPEKECFFQKRVLNQYPYAISTVEELVGLIQLGVLEIHTWGSTMSDIEHPDQVVFDIDPSEELEWKHVKLAAKRLRQFLSKHRLQSYLKVTGGKGLHVVVPIQPELDWSKVKNFSKDIVNALAHQYPSEYTTNMSKAKRKGKIFLDYLRNTRGATFIAPYSTRANSKATLSIPISWDELDKNIKSDHFSLKNIDRRLKLLAKHPSKNPWRHFWKHRQKLPKLYSL